jgi:hypothetical protein
MDAEVNTVPSSGKDRGGVGYLVVIAILALICVALLVSYIVIAAKVAANINNPAPACPNYICADGSDPIGHAILCGNCAIDPTFSTQCSTC